MFGKTVKIVLTHFYIFYKNALIRVSQWKGNIKNIHIFSEDAAEIKTNLSQRGTNEATKYFLIPKELRENLIFSEEVKCQKIETDTRTIFIFVVEKANENKRTSE